MLKIKFIFILLTLSKFVSAVDDEKVLKICVPEKYLRDCKDLLNEVLVHGPQIECDSRHDRFECLKLLQENKADVVAVEPEDVYFAAGVDKGDLRIIAEFRNKEYDEFEDEDQILIKKSSTVKSLKDLKGLKSCHPSFNSYYGYKIPIVILKRHGLLKVSQDPTIPALERELKALSEFFEQSCIVGPYSDDENVDQEWKKKYSNLCQLCQNPRDCSKSDKYSNYDGAIKCLTNGEGDVAFTRRSDIRKYFGLTKGKTNVDVNINDFELLCEDGSRQPINGTGCSLAKRPNRAFMTTTNITDNQKILNSLLSHLKSFFENALNNETYRKFKGAFYLYPDIEKLLIGEEMKLHIRPFIISPKDYIKEFKDYVERDESYTYKVKLCVTTEIELEKCKVISKVALTKDVRPEFECYLSKVNDCAAEVANDKAHIAIIPFYNWAKVEKKYNNIKRITYETWIYPETYIAIFDGYKPLEKVLKYPIKFDNSDKRAHKAACLLHLILGGSTDCDKLNGNTIETENYIQVINATERHNHGRDKVLLCLDKTRSRIGDYHFCNLDNYYQNAIYANREKSQVELDSYKNLVTTISTKFVDEGVYANIFDIYTKFDGHKDVLFNSCTLYLTDDLKKFVEFNENHYDLIMKVLKYNWEDD